MIWVGIFVEVCTENSLFCLT